MLPIEIAKYETEITKHRC